MQTKPVNIGGILTKNNLFLAPLAGYTNYPFRKLCLSYGAGLTFTEMVSAKGLHYGSEGTKELLYSGEEEKIKAVQLFGNDPDILKEACESEALKPFHIVDINMGCPMPKIYNNGEGSALLADMPLAKRLVAACKATGKKVSVKMRIGLTENKIIGADFAKGLEDAGADMITVHGRTKDKIYAEEPNFKAIAEVKKAVGIPVIANGGVFCEKDAEKMLNETGADGVMLARAAMYNPQIFCDLLKIPRESKKDMILTQLSDTEKLFQERFTTVYMRKMVAFYLKGEKGAATWRERLFTCKNPQELRAMVEEIFSYSI